MTCSLPKVKIAAVTCAGALSRLLKVLLTNSSAGFGILDFCTATGNGLLMRLNKNSSIGPVSAPT